MVKNQEFIVNMMTCGGDGTVTGSCRWFQFVNKDNKEVNFLIDIGARKGTRDFEDLNGKFPFDPKELDAVIVTHPHDDHVGLAPVLTKLGYTGSFYGSIPTISGAAIMLYDSAKVRQRNADAENEKNLREYKRKKKELNDINNKRERGRGRRDIVKERKRDQPKTMPTFQKVRPLFFEWDVTQVADQSVGLEIYKWVEILEGLEIKLIPNDHIMGACSVLVRCSNGIETIGFADSGDLGSGKSPILKQWKPRKENDILYVFLETTNIGRPEPDRKSAEDYLKKLLLGRGNVVAVTFSYDRFQQAAYIANDLVEKTGKPIDVHYDGPLGMQVTTQCYMSNREWLNPKIRDVDDPFGVNKFHICASSKESKALDIDRKGKSRKIITTGGMAEGGRSVFHLAAFLGDPDATIVFMGYQAEDTPGRSIIDRAEYVYINGRKVKVLANIVYLPEFTAHACEKGMEKQLNLYPDAKYIVLKHGIHERQLGYAEKLKDQRNIDVITPVTGEKYEMTRKEIRLVGKIANIKEESVEAKKQKVG